MREPNLGIRLFCGVCGRNFWSEDGYWLCSASCEDEYERMVVEEEAELEELEELEEDY